MFSSEICETFKNTFLYRTPPVAASDISKEQAEKKAQAVDWFKLG